MAVDAYCLQHPDRYCASATSVAAHLTGLCAALEYPRHPSLLRALQRRLRGKPALRRPVPPTVRGALTIADVRAATDPDAHDLMIERWARSVWEAYEPLHSVAREWIGRVLR